MSWPELRTMNNRERRSLRLVLRAILITAASSLLPTKISVFERMSETTLLKRIDWKSASLRLPSDLFAAGLRGVCSAKKGDKEHKNSRSGINPREAETNATIAPNENPRMQYPPS
jgi:hypothetical protein